MEERGGIKRSEDCRNRDSQLVSQHIAARSVRLLGKGLGAAATVAAKDYIGRQPSFCTSLLQLCLYRARREWGYVQGGQLGFMPEKDLVASIGAEYITVATLSIQGEKKGLQILPSYSQAGPGREAKQGQEEISCNHVQTFFLGSVHFT